MRVATTLVLVTLLVALVLLPGADDQAEAAPKRRGGGSRRGSSSSSGGGWFGSKKKSNNYGSSSGGGWFGSKKKTGYGSSGLGGHKKSKTMKTLKKAAVIGAVAYGSYKIGQLSSRFSTFGHGGHHYGYGFNDWNRWREADGFMCRDSNDCQWIDRRLYCQDYEMDFQPSVSSVVIVVQQHTKHALS